MPSILGALAGVMYTTARYTNAAGVKDFLSSVAADATTVVKSPLTLYNMAVKADEHYQACVANAASWERTLGLSTVAPLYKTACEGYKGFWFACCVGAGLATYKLYPYAKQAAKHSFALIKGTCQMAKAATMVSKATQGDYSVFNPVLQLIFKNHPSVKIKKLSYIEGKGIVLELSANEESLKSIQATLKKIATTVQEKTGRLGALVGLTASLQGASIQVS